MLKRFYATLSAVFLVTCANAQFTTSTMTGRILDENGEALAGAVVVAKHTPSGTQYYTVSNNEGYYTIQGMRPGGPYNLSVSFVGYQDCEYCDIMLALNETYDIKIQLHISETIDEAVVIAPLSKVVADKYGASINMNHEKMMRVPSTSRAMTSLTKLSPYSNGLGFSGIDGRSTNFTIDGANFNNNFGLSESLPGGGTPISLDALQEVQIVVAPFDVRQSNFVGGAINAITKSGTNKFTGTAYSYYNDENLRGNRINGESLGERALERNKIYGATIGGPIIKDKLFFFTNIEFNKTDEQTIKYRAALEGEEGGVGLVSRTTVADMKRVYDRLVNDYGYNPGSYTDYPGGRDEFRILARLDWNISDRHKFAFRFNITTSEYWNEPNGNSSDDGYRNKAYNRVGQESMVFANNMYAEQSNVWSAAFELNSRFSDRISNQIVFTYTDINEMRKSNSEIFPHIDIMQGNSGSASKPAVSAGYELFTYNNGVKNFVHSFADNLTAFLGSHKLTAGFNWERQNAQNSFMRDGTGYYRFATIDDFVNGELPMSAVFLIGANGVSAPVAELTYNKLAFYAQDELSLTDRLKINYGLRTETIIYNNDDLMTNNAVLAFDMGGRSVDTGLWPKTRLQVSPRFGFRWDIRGDKSLVMRGGAGLFQGRLPLVFFVNMPNNSGMLQMGNVYLDEASLKLLRKADGTMVTDVNEMARLLNFNTTVTSETGAFQSTINGVDRNFKMPQDAKFTLAFDYSVPVSFPLTVTAEGMFSKTIYGVMLEDWAVNNSTVQASRFSGADDRYDYWALESYDVAKAKIKNKQYLYPKNEAGNQAAAAYVLTNTNKGYGWNAALTVKSQPVKNLDLMFAYVHTVTKQVSGMIGASASSAYQALYTVNGANFAVPQNSRFAIPDKFIASASYFIPWKVFNGRGLQMDLFYSGYSPGKYVYVYATDMNGDGNNADLLYIYPSGAEVGFVDHTYTWKENGKAMSHTLSAAEQIAAYDKFLAQDKYMRRHKGEYAEAFAAYAPMVHRFDFRISEDFSFRIGENEHNFQLSISLENVGNMLNSSWGVSKWSCYQTSATTTLVSPLSFDYTAYKESGKPAFYMTAVDGKYGMPTETFSKSYVDPTECWRLLFGIKYCFN